MEYEPINWANGQSGGTPLSAQNLSHMDGAISAIEQISNEAYAAAQSAQAVISQKGTLEQLVDDAQLSALSASNSLSEVQVLAEQVENNATSANQSALNAHDSYERTRAIEEGLGHPLIPMGTIAFEDVPLLSSVEIGWMYNISNDFVTTDDFEVGAGIAESAGSNIYKITDNKWDIFTGPGLVRVDNVLNKDSNNPVANSAIATAIETLEDEVDEAKKSASDGKTLIANAIAQYGGQSQPTDTFAEIAEDAKTTCQAQYTKGVADTKKGTATASDVVKGKTFTSASGIEQNGSLEITSITPSSSPKSVASGSSYKMSGNGYLINTYTSSSKSPTSDGTRFSTGWNYMNSSGYAYSSKPSVPTEELLWTNPSPTASFSMKVITLNKAWNNYKYLKCVIRKSTTLENQVTEYIETKALSGEFSNYSSASVTPFGAYRASNGDAYGRTLSWGSGASATAYTQLRVGAGVLYGGGTQNNTILIPIEIYGVNNLS